MRRQLSSGHTSKLFALARDELIMKNSPAMWTCLERFRLYAYIFGSMRALMWKATSQNNTIQSICVQRMGSACVVYALPLRNANKMKWNATFELISLLVCLCVIAGHFSSVRFRMKWMSLSPSARQWINTCRFGIVGTKCLATHPMLFTIRHIELHGVWKIGSFQRSSWACEWHSIPG